MSKIIELLAHYPPYQLVHAAEMVRAIAKGERVELLVANDEAMVVARDMLGDVDVRLHAYAFGDIWLRDTGPLFLQSPHGMAAAGFRFNFWGGKYDLPGDEGVAAFVAKQSEHSYLKYLCLPQSLVGSCRVFKPDMDQIFSVSKS